MKSGIIALTSLALLSGCAKAHSRALPDVMEYPKSVQKAAADEIEGAQCPTIGEKFIPDYLVMRDQTRALK